MATKRQIITKQKAKYLRSNKKDKSKILTALAETTGLTRRHLIRILGTQYEYEDKRIKSGCGRKPVYGIEEGFDKITRYLNLMGLGLQNLLEKT